MAKDKQHQASESKATAQTTTAETTKPKKNAVTEIPAFKDAEGVLRKLRMKHFPKTKEGKMAFCDYNIERWKARKDSIKTGTDAKAKKIKRAEKLRAKLAVLDQEIASEQ